jgi:hypothetical protein
LASSTVKSSGKLQSYLKDITGNLANGSAVKVGFLEGSTYEDGTPIATVAAVMEFGAVIDMPAREQNIYFRQNKDGSIGNRFVKREKSNFAQNVQVPAHRVVIPARPFFRDAIEKNASGWAGAVQTALKDNDYNASKAMSLVGQGIVDQVSESIGEFNSVPLKPSTIKKKGFDKQLIETGDMQRAVDYEVIK